MTHKDNLNLVDIISGAKNRFFVGVYSDKKRKYIVKRWSGSSKNATFVQIKREYEISSILSRLKIEFVNFPKIITKYQSNNEFSIVYEHISGNNLHHYSLDYQVGVVEKCLDELGSIGKKISKKEILRIPEKSFVNYMVSLPAYWLLFMLHSYKDWKILTKSFLYCVFNLKELYFNSTSIAHGDIKPENIIITKKEKIYLIDCEQMIRTKAGYDVNKIVASNISPKLSTSIKRRYPKLINRALINYICLNYGSSFGRKSGYTENYIKTLHLYNS